MNQLKSYVESLGFIKVETELKQEIFSLIYSEEHNICIHLVFYDYGIGVIKQVVNGFDYESIISSFHIKTIEDLKSISKHNFILEDIFL